MKLTRRSTLTTLGATLAMPFVRPSWAASGSVNIYNWSDYIGETAVADFEAETGISVVYDLYASAEEMQAKLLAGSTGYDVVDMAGFSMPQFIAAGIYQRLDRAKLPNWKNLDPAVLKLVDTFVPASEYGMPYMWGSVGFTFNLDMLKERLPDADPADLGTLFKPENAAKLADCGISILDSPTDIGFIVMSYLGIDPSTAGPAEYEKLAAAFAPIRDYIATFDNANYLTTLPNKEICVANSWSGDYSVAKTRAEEAGVEINLGYFIPKTGAPVWYDVMCIPADAPNVENAHLFLDYMMRPEVAAACSNYTGYANGNAASVPFLDPEIAGNPAVYPDEEMRKRMYVTKPQTEQQDRDLNRIWAAIKAG